jgi:hypothetical protein
MGRFTGTSVEKAFRTTAVAFSHAGKTLFAAKMLSVRRLPGGQKMLYRARIRFKTLNVGTLERVNVERWNNRPEVYIRLVLAFNVQRSTFNTIRKYGKIVVPEYIRG